MKTMNVNNNTLHSAKRPRIIQVIFLLWSLIRCIMSALFALPGIAMLSPLGFIVQYRAERERIKALANSSVKVKGNDVMASIKVTSMMILYPFYCLLFTFGFNRFLRYYILLQRD